MGGARRARQKSADSRGFTGECQAGILLKEIGVFAGPAKIQIFE
jgi:hypothetical protein